MDSILISVKKLLGMDQGYDQFDMDIIMHINSILMSINQLGVGPTTGFFITGVDETWIGLLGTRKDLEAVKTLLYLKVRLIFDPPTTSFVIESMNRQITELEWRLNIQAEGGTIDG